MTEVDVNVVIKRLKEENGDDQQNGNPSGGGYCYGGRNCWCVRVHKYLISSSLDVSVSKSSIWASMEHFNN